MINFDYFANNACAEGDVWQANRKVLECLNTYKSESPNMITKPEKIYIDNSLLVRWFLWRANTRKYPREPEIVRFLTSLEGVKKYISLISVAELVHTLRYGEEFQHLQLTLPRIKELLSELQQALGLHLIMQEAVSGVEIGGVIITPDIIDFVDKHPELADCLHVDIAKRNELWFVTYEKKIGRLKELYANIMTENKLMKQYE